MLLILFTVLEAYMIAGFSASYKNMEVIVAGLGTTLVILSLTIYSRYTIEEIEIGPAFVSIICMAFFPILVVCSIIKASWLYAIILIICLVIYSFFIILDTIIICHSCKSMGGLDVSYDDYLIASFHLYLDVIMVLIYLMKLFGIIESDDRGQ
jgi:FtsH-binding integral membrane protein